MNLQRRMKFHLLSDKKLFEETRKLLIAEFAGLYVSNDKKDTLFTECSKREGSIYESAMNSAIRDSEEIFNKINSYGKVELIPSEKLNSEDIRTLISPLIEKYQKASEKDEEPTITEELIQSLSDKFLTIKVEGDSMIDAGIIEGDIVIAEINQKPKEGDIVVVSVYGNIFIKIFTEKNGSVVLESANKKYSKIVVTPDMDFTVNGVVIKKLQNLKK